MNVTVKQIFTRPSLHDMFWFEFFNAETVEHLTSFLNSAASTTITKLDLQLAKENIDIIRPDIAEMIKLDIIPNIFNIGYDPLSTIFEEVLIFESIETFRQSNQELYSSVGEGILDLIKKANNTVTQEVYDENNVFLEYGLFNIQ